MFLDYNKVMVDLGKYWIVEKETEMETSSFGETSLDKVMNTEAKEIPTFMKHIGDNVLILHKELDLLNESILPVLDANKPVDAQAPDSPEVRTSHGADLNEVLKEITRAILRVRDMADRCEL